MNLDQSSSEKSLRELLEQLAALKREVLGIGEDVVVTLEQKWAQFHSVLFPLLVLHCENWSVTQVTVFQVHGGYLRFLPVLCLAAQEMPLKLSLVHDMAVIEDGFGENAVLMLNRAMASREMEFDFELGLTCAPFCLFEAVVGLFFFKMKELEEANYARLTEATEKLFDRIRREVLIGRITELKNSAKNAG